jgi:hypothetical protein
LEEGWQEKTTEEEEIRNRWGDICD